MTEEQKQKALHLLSICINCDPKDAEVFFSYHPRIDCVSISIYFGGFNQSGSDENYDAYLNLPGGELRLNEAILAVESIGERAKDIIEAKDAKRRAKIIKDYEELINK